MAKFEVSTSEYTRQIPSIRNLWSKSECCTFYKRNPWTQDFEASN